MNQHKKHILTKEELVNHNQEYEAMMELAEQRWIEQKKFDVQNYGFVTSDEDDFRKNYENYIKKIMNNNTKE